jgi:hypothetical protein
MRTGERVRKCGSSPNRSLESHLTMSNSPSRSRGAFFCARGLQPCFAHPEPRGGRSAEKRSGAAAPVGRIMTRYARRLARRLASHNAGRSPLGAPPWRFFTRGRASVSGIIFRIRAASSSQPGRSAWRATSRASRGQQLRAAAAGRHASLRLQDRL